MYWTIIALAMTVLMGGIIAYNGDVIGRKYGKKRISLFGMRPKYTAVLITSMTGVAIACLTTIVLFLLVPPVREIILEGESAIAARSTYAREKKVLEANLATDKSAIAKYAVDLKSKQADLAQSDKNLVAKTGELKRVDQKLIISQQLVAQVQGKLSTAETKYQKLNTMIEGLKSRGAVLTELNSDLAQSNLALSDKYKILTADTAKLTTKNALLAKENDDLTKTNDDVSTRNVTLTRERAQLEKTKEVLLSTNLLLSRDNADEIARGRSLTRTNAELADTNLKLASDNRDLTNLLKELAPGYATVREAYIATRNKRIAIHKDEDLARVVVPSNSSPEKVREVINQLMHDASQEALKKGATPGESARAVQVVDRQFQQQNPDGRVTNVDVSGSDRLDAVISRLCWQTLPMGVMAIAVSNSVEQEPGAIDLQPFPNRLVYAKGHVVREQVINTDKTPDKTFEDLVTFLHQMGVSARTEGVIPHFDPATGEPQIGSVPGSEIVRLMDRVRTLGGRVKIRAVARQDLYSADQLNVDFVVGS